MQSAPPVLQLGLQENPAHDPSAPARRVSFSPSSASSRSARRLSAARLSRRPRVPPPCSTSSGPNWTETSRSSQKQPVPPYFLAYTVSEVRSTELAASFGAMVVDNDNHSRTLGVDVRTGDYSLDNTHEIRGEPAPPTGLGRSAIPLTDSAPGVGVAAWLATDRAYRQSVERLARVKTNLAAKVKEEDPAPDFSREEPQVFVGAPASVQVDKAAWKARLRRLSALFADDPLILRGDVTLSVEANNRYLVNTEGSRLLTGDTACRLLVQAQTKAADGMELPVYATYYARSLSGLPAEAKLLEDVRALVVTLARLRAAPVVDPYSGPGDPLGPRGRRVLPRDLRPPDRRVPAEDGRRCADVREDGGRSRSCRRSWTSWPTRRVRSSATPSWPASTSTTTRACARAAWRS